MVTRQNNQKMIFTKKELWIFMLISIATGSYLINNNFTSEYAFLHCGDAIS